jgi:hypothetical protein
MLAFEVNLSDEKSIQIFVPLKPLRFLCDLCVSAFG